MAMMRGWLILTLALGLAACGQKSESAAEPRPAMSMLDVDVAPRGVPRESQGAPTPALAKSSTPSVALPQIAYTYDYTLELPAKAVVPLFERHRRACEAAGPARCQIIGAETETIGRTDTSATLTLRAESGWLAAFRGRLASDASGADGRVAGSKTESEDLGREISDTGARMRALTTLQGRLEALLANRNGKLADLLATERELARVGGELDATRSALADMRGRVTLPKATINYRPDSLAVAGAEANDGSLGGRLYSVAANSLFLLLNLLAAAVPWLVVLALPVWLLLRLRRKRRQHLDAPDVQP